MGHYSSQCLSTSAAEPKRNLNELTTYAKDDPNPETSTRYLDTVAGTRKEIRITTIEVDGHLVSVKVDTGVEVMVLSETTWNSLNISVPLVKEEISLFSPDQRQLNVVGKKSVKLTYQEKSCS